MELHDASLAVAIPVKDLEEFRRFYEDVMQLPLEAEEPGSATEAATT